MKQTNTLLGGTLLALASSPILAHDWDGNAEMQQSILNDHSSGYVGTSYTPAGRQGQWEGHAELEQSVLNDLRNDAGGGFVGTSLPSASPAGSWDGNLEMEQSILNNI